MSHPLLQCLRSRGLDPRGDLPADLPCGHVTEVSSECRAGSVFVAIKGFKADGHKYVEDAAKRGAKVAIVMDAPAAAMEGVHVIMVSDTRRAAGPLAQLAAGDPSRKLDVVGVTGTNGKTTTVFLMERIFEAAGRKPGIMGTVVNRWAGKEIVANETTPSGPAIARQLAEMLRDGVDSVAFEVSSHAIDQRRVDGIRFRAMALTNVTQDHLDYHKTMEEYAAVKMGIFDRMMEESPEAVACVNVDDATGRRIAVGRGGRPLIKYGIDSADADLRAVNVRLKDDGIEFEASWRGKKHHFSSPIHGRFNVMNCLTAASLALALGIGPDDIAHACASFRGAPGRFQAVEGLPGVKVLVDYAHTPDALIQLLRNARPLAKGRLIAVFGCGGDRDKTKRPIMGRAAAELADKIYVTSDNPRTENPEQILAQIVEGIAATPNANPYRVVPDRRVAIHAAIRGAKLGDVIAIAGKGHEDYQIIGTTKHHFDDREVAAEAIQERLKK